MTAGGDRADDAAAVAEVPVTGALLIDTPLGPGRAHLDVAAEPQATLILGHGAGGGVTSMDLDVLARRLPEQGITVLRFEQPWRLAGRKVAVRPPQLDVGWRALLERLLGDDLLTPRWYVGGRSAGARVACRTAPEHSASGVVCLAFPLHLPGSPERSRIGELLTPTVPRLVLQGTRDTFGSAAEVAEAATGDPGVRVVELPGADHGYRTPKASPFTPAALREVLIAEVAAFCHHPDAG